MAKSCFIGVDVGLTSAKAAMFDSRGNELFTAKVANPRAAVSVDQQEIDMHGLWNVVSKVLLQLTEWALAAGYIPEGIGVTGHGNGLYPVDEHLQPVRSAFASTDNRAEEIVARAAAKTVEAEQARTGSVPWAGQPSVLLAWMAENEPDLFSRTRWALTCKDWISACLTGIPSADYSDASGCGLVDLPTRTYDKGVFARLGLPSHTVEKFPILRSSDTIVGKVTPTAAEHTGLPIGLPVIAGCMDCIASPIGAGATRDGDATIIVGTWAINSVVVPAKSKPPLVTLNALLPDEQLMLAQVVAPTSAASLEWLSGTMSGPSSELISPRDLLHAASSVAAGSEGLLFLPFVHGSPDHPGASGTLLGAKGLHTYAHVARAVAEGVAQYHRVQIEKLLSSGAKVTSEPWTLAGGGARNPWWAQIFADVIGHPVRRQLETEIGARGVASLVFRSLGYCPKEWEQTTDDSLIVYPGKDAGLYQEQARKFDDVLAGMVQVWNAMSKEVSVV